MAAHLKLPPFPLELIPTYTTNLTELQKRMLKTWRDKSRRHLEREMRSFVHQIQAIIAVLMVLGILGNILVCVVMSRRKRRAKRTLSNTFILNLSLADLLYRFVFIIAGIIVPVTRNFVTSLECKSMLYSQYACAAVTFALLAGIAIDRYRNILHPLRCFAHRVNHLKAVLLFWAYGAGVSLGFILIRADGKYKRTFYLPNVLRRWNITLSETYEFVLPSKWCVLGTIHYNTRIAFTAYFFMAFALPLLIMIFTYSSVFRHLSKRSNRNRLNSVVSRSKMKALKMLIVVVVSFVFSWSPILMLTLMKALGYHFKFGEIYPMRPIFTVISHTSSILNPAIYSFGNANFRREVIKLFRDCCCKTKCQKWPIAQRQKITTDNRGLQAFTKSTF